MAGNKGCQIELRGDLRLHGALHRLGGSAADSTTIHGAQTPRGNMLLYLILWRILPPAGKDPRLKLAS